jgi:putative ABC transport system permease protein
MNAQRYIAKSIVRYKSFYRLIAIAVIIAVAVIVGSLVVGDSVRSTLVKRVSERLGNTETVIFSQYGYLEDDILLARIFNPCQNNKGTDCKSAPANISTPLVSTPLNDRAASLRGILLSNGFVSASGRLIPVTVWGVDDLDIRKGETKINQALMDELNSSSQDIVLRLPASGMVPMGSMFVTDAYTTSLRLELNSVLSVEQGGNLYLKNEQAIPLNVFVNREELAEVMDVVGKVNVILSDEIISKEAFDSVWNYSLSGLNVEIIGTDYKSAPAKSVRITSDRIFIQDDIVETICNSGKGETYFAPTSNRYFSYLANGICGNDEMIPYSFITAVDYFKGQMLNSDEIILSDYAAGRLKVGVGDSVCIRYFVSGQFKTLVEDSIVLMVGGIVPLREFQGDGGLRADFPGLSNTERCSDWNSDLPIDMELISDVDEAFWAEFKNTPKAIVPYSALAKRWRNAYGSATALVIGDTNLLGDLLPEMFGIQVLHPRESAIVAAESGVDFSSLFLSLGFFIILSAAMLMVVPLWEMLFRRKAEMGLLLAIGFSRKRVLGLFWREALPTVFLSAVVGVLVGLLYTFLVLFLLGNVWKGATHTDGFRVYPDWGTVGVGLMIGVVLSLILVYFCIRKRVKGLNGSKVKGERLRVKGLNVAGSPLEVVGNPLEVVGSSLEVVGSPLEVAGNPLEVVGNRFGFAFNRLPLTFLRYNKRQALLSFVTLACGVLIVFLVGLNRRGFADSSEIRTATGGFSLWCETSVPVYHNIETVEGRAKLGLGDLGVVSTEFILSEAEGLNDRSKSGLQNLQVVSTPLNDRVPFLQLLKYSADDASCLNLNKVSTPNVLGVDMGDLLASDFKISKTIFDKDEAHFDGVYPERSRRAQWPSDKLKTVEDGLYPALVDETVLTWGLMKKLGDTLVYVGDDGRRVSVLLAGTLSNSIFQGCILMDKGLFSEIWSEISGSEVMLIRVEDSLVGDTEMLVSQALNDYGVRIMTTGERMKLFYSVTDTYLTIFLTLGGLGLLIGIFSFIIVVRKNLLAKMGDIGLWRSLGFGEGRIYKLLYNEIIIVPLCAIAVGVLGSLLGVSMGFGNVSMGVWALSVVFLILLVGGVMVFVGMSIRKQLQNK